MVAGFSKMRARFFSRFSYLLSLLESPFLVEVAGDDPQPPSRSLWNSGRVFRLANDNACRVLRFACSSLFAFGPHSDPFFELS